MGLRGFFEESYSGDSLQGIYVAGIYYPDKTRVGWWKVGYPEFFAKVVNSTNWIGIGIEVDEEKLDLATCKFKDYKRELNMKTGELTRTFTWLGNGGKETAFIFSRFLSMADNNIACITITAVPLNHNAKFIFTPFLNGDVTNEDSNYGEKFWDEVYKDINQKEALLMIETKKTGFVLSTAMSVSLKLDGKEIVADNQSLLAVEKFVGYKTEIMVEQGKKIEIEKIVAVCTSMDHKKDVLQKVTVGKLRSACQCGFDRLYKEHCCEMQKKWDECDVVIEGDIIAQQGIRYNIFQLNQTYMGKDSRLNIGPKGFTGEKYGGSTYWDTEAFCLPFYLYTNENVAKNLLYYRFLHLDRARENAAKLGFKGALYPMVTMDGQECHNEWEITFEEIHRNGAIAYAIFNYTKYTGDTNYLTEYGIEVLVEISRFWEDRVNYNANIDKYMILGVTGPNEYENNVNNNWYTNTMASWTMEYTLASLKKIKENIIFRYNEIITKLNVSENELIKWKDIVDKMYYPKVEELGIFEQNDLYMDKEQILVKDLPKEIQPLNKHWSWDRILRSCFIKQADVIQGIYFFPEKFTIECQRKNFDFYEPRTVHESSLSASIHSIVASRIGYNDKAYEFYLRTARLDLDNYNADTDEGIHLTSMAASWSSIIEGFAGLKVMGEIIRFNPYLPSFWKGYSFKVTFRGRKLKISLQKEHFIIEQQSGEPMQIFVFDKEFRISENSKVKYVI